MACDEGRQAFTPPRGPFSLHPLVALVLGFVSGPPAGPLREFVQMARKQQAEQWAEHRRQCAEEERRQRVMVITEFDAGDFELGSDAYGPNVVEAELPCA